MPRPLSWQGLNGYNISLDYVFIEGFWCIVFLFFNETVDKCREITKKKKKRGVSQWTERKGKKDANNDYLNRIINQNQQYSCKNYILIHGVKENQIEDNDVVVTKILSKNLKEKFRNVLYWSKSLDRKM